MDKTKQETQKNTSEMASLNGVADRVVTKSTCSQKKLKTIPIRDKMLLIFDSEGCEKELLDQDIDADSKTRRNLTFFV